MRHRCSSAMSFSVLGAFVALVMLICGEAISRAAVAASNINPPETIRELEDQIFASRRKIKSGEFKFRTVNPGRGRRDRDISIHCWFTADGRIREERDYGGEDQVSIFAADFAYYYATRPEMLDHPDLVLRPMIERIPVHDAKPTEFPYAIVDPRKFMLIPEQLGLLRMYELDSFVGAADRENIRQSPTTWEGLRATTVSFTTPRFGNHFEYDVVPTRDYAIVRWHFNGTPKLRNGSSYTFDQTFTCTLTQLPGSIWFPSQVDLKALTDGKPGNDQRLIVTPIQVNGEIPDRMFTLGKLPSGLLVATYPVYSRATTQPARPPTTGATLLYWKDGKIGPLTRKDEEDRNRSHKEFDSK